MTAGAFFFALATVQGAGAHAQWGYPLGYANYGWGGWGGQTVQGNIARGLGAYAAGAGYYNQQTAVANSINTDTVMRWNQYVYESQMNANRLHQGRLALDRYQTNKAIDQVRDRLRNNPEQADIFRGDALNSALDEINDPRVYAKALQGAQAKISPKDIRNIPFQKASAAITMSIHQITQGGPPASLRTPEFEAERTAIRMLGREVRKELEEDKAPDREKINKLLGLITKAEDKADAILPKGSRGRIEADRYLKALHGLVAMLQTPALDLLLAGLDQRPEATLGELLTFMNVFNLRFGMASTPEQKIVYKSLYPKLVDLRNQIAPALAATASPASSTTGTEPYDFFSGMDYQDLKKKAPAPAPPAPGAKP